MEMLRLNDIRIGDWFVHVHGRGRFLKGIGYEQQK